MQRKVIISCAVTGSADTPGRNPAVPVTPEQIANSAIDAAKAGAAIVHIHVRDPNSTKPSMDTALYREVVERIRASGTDVLINLTTGPGARFTDDDSDPSKPGAESVLKSPEERVRHVVELKPDICSLDMGSLNMGDRVFVNTPKHLQAMAVAIKDAGVMPELEVFETGHLLLTKRFIENGYVKPPGMFQICLGISWGQPATTEAMAYMRSLLPPDSPWFAFGISLHQFPMVAQTILLGGHPRVGLEDNIYLERASLRRAIQSAPKFDPRSASNFDPLERRVRTVALAPSERAEEVMKPYLSDDNTRSNASNIDYISVPGRYFHSDRPPVEHFTRGTMHAVFGSFDVGFELAHALWPLFSITLKRAHDGIVEEESNSLTPDKPERTSEKGEQIEGRKRDNSSPARYSHIAPFSAIDCVHTGVQNNMVVVKLIEDIIRAGSLETWLVHRRAQFRSRIELTEYGNLPI